MNILRHIAAPAILLALCSTAGAQRYQEVKLRLSQPDSSTRARINIVEHGMAGQAVARVNNQTPAAKMRGYRVRIFFDNGQHARSNASAVLSQFKELYPDIPAGMVYENPYFKVTVGNCISSEEAIILWGRIKKQFDKIENS